MLIGRFEEIEILNRKYDSDKSEFVALYGRRRIGKTYLIRSLFKDKFTFHFTGMANVSLKSQLTNFNNTLQDQHPNPDLKKAESWIDAFRQLRSIIEKSRRPKKVIFLDELPWLDTMNSNFIPALEHFWNGFASQRSDVLLIVCGSAASWMIQKLINNKGGLHNRITQKIRIDPFSLKDCALLLEHKHIQLEPYQLVQLYMVLGGIPYYWDAIEKGKSAAQNIDTLCFGKTGLLANEFENLFKSLFNKSERHELIIQLLSKKNKGLTRDEICTLGNFTNGGSLTRLLNELEESGFIKRYHPYGKKTKNSLYQLVDFYSLFYLKWIKGQKAKEQNFWTNVLDNAQYKAWSGYTFELICLTHIKEIKLALGISGMNTEESAWRGSTNENGAQIDLIIDRKDGIIHLCEMKFAKEPFQVDKKYDLELKNKIQVFKSETKTKKTIFLTFVTPFGIKSNVYSNNVQNSLTLQAFLN